MAMKKHYLNLFEYNHWANLEVFDFLCSLPITPEAPLKLLKHMIAAEEIWLSRCENRQSTLLLWEMEVDMETVAAVIQEIHERQSQFLQSLQDEDFYREVTYHNSTGKSFTNTITDILTHVVNHGTYHRGQIVEMSKAAKLTLPVTDFSHWTRSKK